MKKAQVNIWLFFMLLGSAFAVVSCDTNDLDENNQRLTETDFVVKAANSDLFEIQTGRLASIKSNLTEVRELGQYLVMEHTNSSTQLKNLAELKKITIPDSLSEDKRVHRIRLASQTGAAFDKDFVNTQIIAHDEAISLYEQASRELQDPDLKNFAAKTLDALHTHREQVVMIKSKTDAL
ncbi:DUF4142 domain-containing protein [Adhaeribacter radiodurans]|uniref:DUF4142 domain-containing protein n=1 Tax=Adhaeribacter radiodurans TaxID=2745197 RepID=A0A7L7L9Z1_9BACT|nr:DUF4142 domain-containing protein [Adhaeribacter radiodurans]QMU29662.1 DUF4142 domain-containing protein [Adhaeribacter radiodurans]